MTPEPIPLQSYPTLECRSCGAVAPIDEHFCAQCSRLLALARNGDYFSFLGLPRRLGLDLVDLERRFRDLSRKFHPDYYHNASQAERLARLERSSYLNDAYRVLKNPTSRTEYLLALEGFPAAKGDSESAKVPPALLEEVFLLNEELDEIRGAREAGADPAELRARLERAKAPIERKRAEHELQLKELGERWDRVDPKNAAERRATLEALRDRLMERSYIANLIGTIAREAALVHG
jgi:molecular chaperone HscB